MFNKMYKSEQTRINLILLNANGKKNRENWTKLIIVEKLNQLVILNALNLINISEFFLTETKLLQRTEHVLYEDQTHDQYRKPMDINVAVLVSATSAYR